MDSDLYDTSAVRRRLHSHPETAFLEIQTATFIWESLGHLAWSRRAGQDLLQLDAYAGMPDHSSLTIATVEARAAGVSEENIARFRDGATTIVADLEGDRPGPTVGLRFDIDALPVNESRESGHIPNKYEFRSRYPGRMHACGHDGHVAIGLMLAAQLSANRDFPGTVRLIFQPAEEGVRGARPIVDAGLCDELDKFVAVHLGFGASKNSVGYATDLFGTSKFETRFEGVSAHASNNPEAGRNSLLAASHAVLALHSLPRFSHAQTRVNVGHLSCEGASNVIPGLTIMRSEVRASDPAVHQDLERRALRVFEHAAAMSFTKTTTVRTGYAVAAASSVELYESLAADCADQEFTACGPHPMYASDDATLMMERVTQRGGTACYLVVGSGDYGSHHSSLFDFDEDVLPRASGLIERFIRAQRTSL